MHYKFTLKNMGRFLRTLSILLVLACSFAGTANAQCAWTSSTVFPTTTLDMPVATVGTNMYSFGGVQNGALPVTSYKFNGTAWTTIANLPQGLEFASATSDGTNIFVIGGASTTGVPQTTNYRYNVAANTYTTMAPCATGTWSHAAVYLNGKIYKIGGINAASLSATTVEIYDVTANTWSAGAAYPAANGFISAVTIGGYIYTAGGIDAAGTNKTYRYDPATNTWDDAAIADLPASRWGAAAAPYRGFALAGGYVGGDATPNISTSTITWDPSTNTWTTGAPMPGERSRFAGEILNDAFYVVGGRSVASAAFIGSNNNYKLTCPPVTACSGTPNPGNTFATSTSVCSGTPTTLSAQNPTSGGGVTYQWQTSATLTGTYTPAPGVSTNPTYTVSPTATAFYRVQVTCGGNPGTSTPVQVTVTLCTCLTPDAATICEGTIQSIKVNGTPTTGSVTATSGPINVAVPDNDPTGVTSGLSITLPAGAVVTSVVVGFDMTHTFDGDMVFNIKAPNGQILNLTNREGSLGDNFTGTFVNTAITSPTFASSASPFTGTFAPDAATGQGPTGSISNATAATLFTPGIASGTNTWTLAMVDIANGDLGNLTGWSIKVNYSIFPTATWTGGAFFTNAAATTAYVAGTQANTVYVKPTATTTYTANIASGPCAGPNTVIVTVIPRPVITVSPATGCGPLTITASGATTYSWTPGAGLNNTTGATVIANPTSTTTYSVTGIGNTGCTSLPLTSVVNSAPTASVIAAVAGSTFQLNEAFATVPPTGWTITNVSNPVGATSWFKPTGTPPFPSHSGAATDYAGANYQNTTATAAGDISDWFISPVVNIKNGDEITFWTRTTDISPLGNYADRLQVRLSTAGTSVNVGATSTSTGDFTALLLDINPTLQATGVYPNVWTRFVATVSGVTGTVQGRFAFRYFVTNGGGGANSDFIGVDDVSYSSPATVNCASTVTNIKVDITGGVGPYTVVFSNGTASTTVPNYISGSNIQVSPAATTTYTIVSVTGANGCTGTGNTGSAVISITPPASITTQPAATSACVGGNATITVAAGPIVGNTYQWQVSTDGGTTYTNITNNATYGGATTNALAITGATAAMANNRYRVIVTGACGAATTSNAVVLTVNTPAVITTQPVATFVTCSANGASVTVAATGNQLTYQWQVSTDGGTTYTNISNGAIYSGVTTNTLTFVSTPLSFVNNKYRVQLTTGGCALVNSSAATLTAINPVPVVVISVSPSSNVIPGSTVTLTAATSPNAAATYQWYNNGVPVAGATANTLVVGVNGVGTYTVKVTDVNGCSNTALASTPASITVGSEQTTQLFIYPSPNTGKFQVRYFNDINDGTNSPAILNVYDSKGSRVFTKRYVLGAGYQAMQVDLASHGKGVYRIDLLNTNGERLKTGNVLVY